jgi:transcriptional regulator with XRE-family HTH domain
MKEAATLIREAREEAGLSLRALAERSDVSYTTICRVEHGRMDPTTGTLRKLLAALGQDLELRRRHVLQGPQLASLVDAWSRDRFGQDQPEWPRLRALLDHLARRPELAAQAIRPKPPASGSIFFDNLLAGIAEKIANDIGTPRPAWTKRIPELNQTWESLGTARMRAAAAAATPPQLAARHILIPAASLWRRTP